MDKIKRAIHLDFHTMPGIYDFGREWDATKFANTLKDAHVTYINAFAQCNFGFAYYPTKIGVPYPTMKGDMFGSLLSECHKVGIKVCAYINVGINNEQARMHSDWCKVDAEGRIVYGENVLVTGFKSMCYNTGYRDYLLATIKEILTYDVDGIFCDCMALSRCYCSHCIEDMINEGLDITDTDDTLYFANKVRMDISRDIRAIVPQDKYLILNGIPYDSTQDLNSHIEIECLPSGLGGWSYDFFSAQSAFARNVSDNVLYMTGRFQVSWGDFGGLKTKASIENDAYDALCNNLEFSVGDHMHPAENLEKDTYIIVGEIYEDLMRYEKWTSNTKYISEIGILRNKSAYNTMYLEVYHCGVSRILSELKYDFDIVTEDMEFDRFEVLILPDEIKITEKLKEKISAHLATGKKVISSGFSALNEGKSGFALKEWDFVKLEGIDNTTTSYYSNKCPIDNEARIKWAMYAKGILMSAKNPDEVVSSHIKQYFNDKFDKPYFDRGWEDMHLYCYLPPEKETGYAAVAMRGNVCQISFKIFESYYYYASKFHKDLIAYLLKQMLPNPLVKVKNIPSTARVTTTGTENYTLVHVKSTYPEPRGPWFKIIEEHTTLPAGGQISLRGNFKTIKLLPDEVKIDSQFEDDYTTFILPRITGYAMFLAQ